MTNEERLKALPTQEMANLLDDLISRCGDCPAREYCETETPNVRGACRSIIAEWLRQPERKEA